MPRVDRANMIFLEVAIAELLVGNYERIGAVFRFKFSGEKYEPSL